MKTTWTWMLFFLVAAGCKDPTGESSCLGFWAVMEPRDTTIAVSQSFTPHARLEGCGTEGPIEAVWHSRDTLVATVIGGSEIHGVGVGTVLVDGTSEMVGPIGEISVTVIQPE